MNTAGTQERALCDAHAGDQDEPAHAMTEKSRQSEGEPYADCHQRAAVHTLSQRLEYTLIRSLFLFRATMMPVATAWTRIMLRQYEAEAAEAAATAAGDAATEEEEVVDAAAVLAAAAAGDAALTFLPRILMISILKTRTSPPRILGGEPPSPSLGGGWRGASEASEEGDAFGEAIGAVCRGDWCEACGLIGEA